MVFITSECLNYIILKKKFIILKPDVYFFFIGSTID